MNVRKPGTYPTWDQAVVNREEEQVDLNGVMITLSEPFIPQVLQKFTGMFSK